MTRKDILAEMEIRMEMGMEVEVGLIDMHTGRFLDIGLPRADPAIVLGTSLSLCVVLCLCCVGVPM